MSKFDIMRAVAAGTMQAPEVPPEALKPRRMTLEGKPTVKALSSIKLRPLKSTDRFGWLEKLERDTGQT